MLLPSHLLSYCAAWDGLTTPAKVAEAVSFASSLGVSDRACSLVQGE